MTQNVGEQLLSFYQEWGRKSGVVTDRNRPVAERLEALHWIDDAIGQDKTPPERLEEVTRSFEEFAAA